MYRDSRDQCPRCGEALIDARAARACSACFGMWLGVGDVQEMAQRMHVPERPIELPFATDSRQALPCPDCTEPMRTLTLYEVPVDVCQKHGVWFDANELARVLFCAARDAAQ
jgi:Zn-finger nucleic acid-binding protein